MGIVRKQAIGNSLVQYAGFAIGFVNVTFLFPNIFTADQFGLTRIMVAVAAIYAQFSALGGNRMLVRFMPMFRTADNKNSGILLLGSLLSSVGFLLFTSIYLLFQDQILGLYKEQSALFINNYLLVVPLAFFMLGSLMLEAQLMGMFRTVFSNFQRHVLIRLLWLLDILLYHFGLVNWETFLILFVYFYALNLAVLAIYLIARGGVSFKIPLRFRRKSLLRPMGNYSMFSMLGGLSNFLVNRIDVIMVGFMTASGLNNAAIYSIAVYMASVIFVPAQAVARISFPLIADKWRERDIDGIADIYRKSARDQLLIGGALFLLIWANVNNIFQVLPPEYTAGKWALFFLGLAKLFDMMTGVNAMIINATKFYRFDLYSSIFLMVTTIFLNLWLISTYGLVGAAMATAISVLLFNFVRFLYLVLKLKMQPFTMANVYALLALLLVFLAQDMLPQIGGHFVIDLLLRSLLIVVLLISVTYYFKLSDELNDMLRRTLLRLRGK